MTHQTETVTGDELVYDYPGRSTRLKDGDKTVLDIENFGAPDFVFSGRVEGREKFTHFYPPDGDEFAVEISYREVELVGGGTGRDGTRIEHIEVV